jgi:ribose 5-phosphate isomerase B
VNVIIGSDHAGYLLKEAVKRHLSDKDIPFTDIGTFKMDSVNYPEYSYKLSTAVANGEYDFGILICGTGIGMCITANKIKGIRAAQAYSVEQAKLSRLHNDANVLCLGGRISTEEEAFEIVDTWLNTSFEGGRHLSRINLISQLTGL